MNKRNFNRVLRVATAVRSAFEEIAKTEGAKRDLGGYCGRASVQVYLACKRFGIKDIELWDGEGHTFNVYGGTIVDVTATQFKKKRKVYTCLFSNRKHTQKKCEYDTRKECNGQASCASLHWSWDGRDAYLRDRRVVERHLLGKKKRG